MKAKSIAALFPLALTMNSISAEWERLAPLPESNGGFVSGVVHGEIVIAGGTNWKDDTKQWPDAIDSACRQQRVIGQDRVHADHDCIASRAQLVHDF